MLKLGAEEHLDGGLSGSWWFTYTPEELGVSVGRFLFIQRLGEKKLRVYSVFINPDQRHKGYGSRMMQEAIIEARRRGITRVWLNVDADNSFARACYGKAGFIEIRTYYTHRPWDRVNNHRTGEHPNPPYRVEMEIAL